MERRERGGSSSVPHANRASLTPRNPRGRPGPHPPSGEGGRRPRRAHAEVPKVPLARITPYAAAQDQPARHGIGVVRSGAATAPGGGSVLFFSSVQKRGGAFTSSERETYTQLNRTRAVQRPTEAARTPAPPVVSRAALRESFTAAEATRRREDLEKANAIVQAAGRKRSRFAFISDDDDDDDRG